MNFTNNRYEKMMKQRPQPMAPSVPKAPRGSRCAGCPYWRGHPLCGLLPGAFENPWREVRPCPVN